ncbi:hypothetical protein QWY20_14055 [Alkalimonas sp. MEB108]|uniref:Lipoprotein n=1 Tax=Alkalimonas cellulosilytica TaxID=3058395 RepID=A0ABU7J7R7_9GAMM|nr:hypothetical protein [Alkalimonas sp. MEB108]MEE2002578.1 hypothetical protein [Alkalimonas sp. MEB108]
MFKLSMTILLGALVAGCASAPSSNISITGEVREAISVADVAIYQVPVPPGQYTEIAALSVTSPSSLSMADHATTEQLIHLLKSEAAAIGANGVILTDLNDVSFTTRKVTYDGVQSAAIDETRFQRKIKGYAVAVE